MRHLKISSRLLIAFGFIILLALSIAGLGAWRTLTSLHDNEAVQGRNVINAIILQWGRHVEVNGERARAVAHLPDPEQQAAFQQRMNETSKLISREQDKVGSLIRAPQALKLYDKILQARQSYTQARKTALQDLTNGNDARARRFFSNEMPALLADYRTAIDDLYSFQDQYEKQLFDASEHSGRTTLLILGAMAALTLLLGPLFAWLVSRSITRPLSHAVRLAAAVSRRDLSHDIQPRGRDEVARLEVALRDMAQGLRHAVGDVHVGADSIAAAANQITAGNLDLSSRTEQQSSSLAETAATMEEITATVRQNADNAGQANDLAASASASARHGGDIVENLVRTMGDISTRSQQVADIISTIDSIAFQVNILALNAAVEAARAGDQGRGFAVVAAEVRTLAQRTAGAAKEIKNLIQASVDVTSQGNEQAAQAGEAMHGIVHSIQRVTDIMREISAASREQTTGIEEINAAIAQMDDVTRQNAALVEESAAAAASLQTQADTLAAVVATFRLEGAATGAVPANTSA